MISDMLKKIKEYLEVRRELDKRMVEIDEMMNLDKISDTYGKYVCKMNGWKVREGLGYSMVFAELCFTFQNGYIRALRDNGFKFKAGLVKPIDPNRDLPCGALPFYDEDLRKKILGEAVNALREVMAKYEPDSKINQNQIVSAFMEAVEFEEK